MHWGIRTAAVTLVTLVLALASARAQQQGTVEGHVRDAQGAPLLGATVRVEDVSRGAAVDSAGHYVIPNVPSGEQWLRVTFVGYAEQRRRISVPAAGNVTADFTLNEASIQGREVTVRAHGKRQAQSDTRTSVTRIEPREAKYLPGAAEDVMRSLRSLPGVLAPNDFSAQLVVRGSGPDQNLILIDGIEVFNPYRLYGLVSMFNPETVSDVTLLTGGFPARYGDRLSAVLDVTNREGERAAPLLGKLNASITNANLVLEGSLPESLHGGWLLSGRRTYYDLIAGPILRAANVLEGDVALPNFQDVQFKATANPVPEHGFVLDALFNRDGTDITSSANRDRIDSLSVVDRSYNAVLGASWRYTPTPNVLSKTTLSWYRNNGSTQFGGEGGSRLLYGDLSRDSVIKLLQALPPELQDSLRARGIDPNDPPGLSIGNGNAGFSFRKYTVENETSIEAGGNLVEFGAGVDMINTGLEFSAEPDSLLLAFRQAGRQAFPDSIQTDIDYYRAHAYAQDRIELLDGVWLQPGLRFDYYKIIDRAYLSPRVAATWAIDPITTLRGAFGVYYQSPGYEKLIDGNTFYDLTAPEVQDLKAERSMHYVLGLDRMLNDTWQVKFEGYYKSFSDLIVQQKVNGVDYISEPTGENPKYRKGWTTPVARSGDSLTTIPVNDATGDAYGFEVMLQRTTMPNEGYGLNGWISYTLAWANRYRDGVTFPFNFDQRHTLNLVANYRFNSWFEAGMSFTYGSGYPYTPAIGFHPIVVMAKDSTGATVPTIATNLFGNVLFSVDRGGVANINSARLPDYQRLDVRGTFYTHWFGWDWSWYLDIANVYNHTNLLTRSYNVDQDTIELTTHDVTMFPILPTLGMSVKF